MHGTGCVIAGVDFSPSSRRALDVAAVVAARARAPLELVHVSSPGATGVDAGPPAPAAWIDARRGQLTERLQEWADDARAAGAEARCRVVEGTPSRVLPEVARASEAALMVVGRRGAANLAHVLLGSVSERVLHLSPCPVLVVPRATAAVRPPERLLVGVDFSSGARDAYRAALDLAARLRVERGLVLVHAYPGDGERWLEGWSELAHREPYPYDRQALERWAEIEEGSPVRIRPRVLSGVPERLLLETAQREGCDWLVIGACGRSTLAALLLGSTTDRILKRADRPVLVVPSSESGS